MMNSISTIFTIDIYKPYIEKNASEGKLVRVGRLCSLAIGTFVFSIIMKFAFQSILWMDRMLIVFILCVLIVFITTFVERKGVSGKAIEIMPELFKTSRTFNIVSVVIMVILVIFYTISGNIYARSKRYRLVRSSAAGYACGKFSVTY